MSALRLLMLSPVLAAFLVAGCDKAPSKPAKPAATAAAAATTPAAGDATTPAVAAAGEAALPPLDLGEFKVISITLGNQLDAEKNVIAAKTVFSPKDAIHASVVSTGKHQGLKMTATWTTADGLPIAETEQVLVPESAVVSTFSLNNAEPWPTGLYKVSISLEGREQQSIGFEVR